MSHIQVLEDGKVVYDSETRLVVPSTTTPLPPVVTTPVPTPPTPLPETTYPNMPNIPGMIPSPIVDTGSTSAGGLGYTGYELTPGNPKINEAYAGLFAVYTFSIPDGRLTRVYYQQPGNADAGMKVTSFVKRNGVLVSQVETRVLANKQPFDVQGPGSFEFHVMPEKSGPISVGLE